MIRNEAVKAKTSETVDRRMWS